MSFLDFFKSILPGLSDRSLAVTYFESAFRMEYENLEYLRVLSPLIKYPFLQEVTDDLFRRQEKNCFEIDIEIASNQIGKQEKPTIQIPDSIPNDYQKRSWLINQLLENTRQLSATYLHLSYQETIALSTNYERLHHEKDQQVVDLMNLAIKIN